MKKIKGCLNFKPLTAYKKIVGNLFLASFGLNSGWGPLTFIVLLVIMLIKREKNNDVYEIIK